MEGTTEGSDGTTEGFSEEEEAETLNITVQTPHTTLPSSTSVQVDSDLRLLEPSGEAVSSFSDVSSTTSSEVSLLLDNKESVPLDSSEDDVSPPWLTEWTDLDSPTGPTVASEKPFSFTQSPETVIDPNSESAAIYQSDSSTDAYFRVSAEDTCADR